MMPLVHSFLVMTLFAFLIIFVTNVLLPVLVVADAIFTVAFDEHWAPVVAAGAGDWLSTYGPMYDAVWQKVYPLSGSCSGAS